MKFINLESGLGDPESNQLVLIAVGIISGHVSGLTCWKCVGEECSGENFEEYSEKIHCEQGESCMVGLSIKIIAIIKNRQTILVIL